MPTELHVGLHVRCLILLSIFNKNQGQSNFSASPHYQFLYKSLQLFQGQYL